jgi:molybdopterin-containing oxidoreductase family membrane subunit
MMAFNSWMYTAFLLIAALCWFLSYRMDNGWLRPLLCLGLFFSVLFPSQSGAFFGVVDAKGFWHSPLLPMLFLVSALTAGAALLLFVRVLTDAGSLTYMTTEEERREEPLIISRLRWITLVGVFTYFVLEFAEFSILLWNPTGHAPEVRLILGGPYWWVFWLVHILLGGVIPIVLLLSRFRPGWVVGALLVAVCFLSARMNVLIPGQAVGEIRGLQEAFQGDRLSYIYHATRMEYFVGLLLIAMGMAVYVVGRRVNQLAGKIIPELFQSNGKSL